MHFEGLAGRRGKGRKSSRWESQERVRDIPGLWLCSMTAKAQRHSIPEHSESSRKGCNLKHDLSVTSWIKIINTLWVKESKVSQEICWFAELRCVPAELKSDSYKRLSSHGQRSFLIVCSYSSHSLYCHSLWLHRSLAGCGHAAVVE